MKNEQLSQGLHEYAQTRDRELRDRLFEGLLPLSKAIAAKFTGRGMPREDLEQVAAMGLLKALERYEPDRNLRFVTYAVPTITGDLRNYLRDKGSMVRAPRDARQRLYQLARLQERFEQEHLRTPSAMELAQEMGITPEEMIALINLKRQTEVVSLDAPVDETGETRRELEEREIRVSREDFNIDNMLITLRQYYKGGRYDFLLNSRANIDLLSKRFVVFEVDSIKENKELFPVVTIIIMEAFINKMRRLKGVRKQLIVEEAWKALSTANMAEYLRYMYKTVRKYYGEAIVVTQEVEDIISSPVVKEAIINNSDCKILLDQRKYLNKFDSIQNLLGLTDKERSQILSINMANHPGRKYKEVFFSLGGTQSAVYATEVSLEEYYTFTTEESEKMELFALAEKLGGNLELAIKRLAESKRNPQSSTT